MQFEDVLGYARLAAGLLLFACLDAPGAIAADGQTASSTVSSTASSAVPPRPEEPLAAKAYTVLDTYCARCHQTGKLEHPLASGGLANILDIDDLARDPILVKPGFPDASRLYDVLETRHAPLDVFTGPNPAAEPQPDDIIALRRWLKDIPNTAQTCPSRRPISLTDIDKLMRDAQHLERQQGKEVRFISLVHLYNACATPEEMASYVAALNKLMNSLSSAPEPVKLTQLDAAGTVLSFRLSDFGWDAARWAMIEKAYPPALVHAVAPAILKTAQTKAVVVNGDWLAAAAGETPLYYDLLGIPQKLSSLAAMNGAKIDDDIRGGSVRRIAVRESAVTRGNRLIERHPGDSAGLWLVYDFSTSNGDQNVFTHPLGPKSATNAAAPFKADEVRALFALPNGFYAFALYDAGGNRVDRVLPGIEKPYAGDEANAVEPTTKAGTDCFACHTEGLVKAKDDFRSAGPVDISSAPMPADRRAALPLFGTDGENALLMLGGTDRFRAAAKSVGIDLNLRIHGEEMVSGLARRYGEGADFEVALSETGLERKDFLNELSNAKGQAAPLARRLLHGVLSRAQLEQLFSLLKGIDKPKQTASAGFLREVKTEIGLSMWLDKPRPVPGDLVTIKAEADNDCYLTVISVDAEGVGTVLFPSDFQRDNLIKVGTTVSIPSPTAPFQLRFKAEGSETILGRCSTTATPPVGIEHDFVRQRFTVLGNWENFIRDTLVTDWEMRADPEKAERARIARAGAVRRREAQGERIEPPRPDVVTDRPLRDGRAVLILGLR
ncbi:MAG: DUF4384 domain-containing protein [Proteobacteria bacterium]|nr:DUF4384 domain-containing protein [Pseudomonadota bacterium]